MLSESKMINFLQQEFSITGGIGDDCATCLENQVISKDLLVEDVHFRRRYTNSKALAHKALHVNLSDIAAMGAKANYILLGLAIPQNYSEYIDDFLVEFSKECKVNEIALIGGDISSSLDKLFISITILGIARKPKLRNTAKLGDIICVAGNLGHAYIGLQALEQNIPHLDKFKEAFLTPNAAIKEGLWLGQQEDVSAMMDISDGLFIDLKKLCNASSLSGEINLANFEITADFINACQTLAVDPLSVQLMGGEDYGLLITVTPEFYTQLSNNFITRFGYSLKNIGRIITGNTGEVVFNPTIDFKFKIFSHFGEL